MSFFKVLLATILGFFISLALLFLILFGMTVGLLVSSGETEPTLARQSVLEIDLSDPIAEYRGELSVEKVLQGDMGGMTLRTLLDALRRARTDERIVAIRLMPSGYSSGWTIAEEIRQGLDELRRAGKTIIATSDANGFDEVGYYLASAADSIYLKPSAQIELNGIGGSLMFFKPALDRLGIHAETVRAGKFKNAIEPFILEKASAETEAMMRDLIEGTFAQFTSAVTGSRGISLERLDSLVNRKGLILASDAVREGLADGVLYEDQIVEALKMKTGRKADERLRTASVAEYAWAGDDEATDQQIAIVFATGVIRSGESGQDFDPVFGGASVGDQTFREAMKSARESDAVKAVVLRIDSPGGSAAAGEEMWREIRLTADEKPVIASMGSTAASGGYYMAAAADTIVADATTLTGSIGVFGLWFDVSGFFRETLGINMQVITSDTLADMMSAFRSPTELERAIIQNAVDTVYQRFLQVVAQGRGMTTARVDEIGQGRVYLGEEAKRLGLVDEIGGLHRALEIAAARAGLDSSYSVRVLPRPKNFFESLTESFAGGMGMLAKMVAPAESLVQELQHRKGVQMRAVEIRIQ